MVFYDQEHPTAVAAWELFLVIEHHRVRRPMGGKCRGGREFVRARAHLFAAVTAVFRRKNQLFGPGVVVALGPAIVAACSQKQQLFSRLRGFLVRFVEIGPIRIQLVPSVLGDKYATAS